MIHDLGVWEYKPDIGYGAYFKKTLKIKKCLAKKEVQLVIPELKVPVIGIWLIKVKKGGGAAV